MKKIVIAEDDEFLSDLVVAKLLKRQMEAVQVSDGDQVINTVVTHKPDVLLLDIDLPNKSGFEVLKELRGTPSIAKTSVIIFTNDDTPEIKQRAKEYEATFFLKAMTGGGELIQTIVEKLK